MKQSKYDKALEAIREVFADTSVSKAKTLADLQCLIDEIEIMIDSLESDDE